MKAFLVGKGKSLDFAKPEWFGVDEPVWCLNQATSVVCNILKEREIHCVQNDDWIQYTPPTSAVWHCAWRVPVGSHPNVKRYNVETLTGNWSDPTCMCALNLMKNEGFDEITMIGFDSHFDGSLVYADAIGVKSKQTSDFTFYDTMMRRFARDNGMKLTWVDKDGVSHEDDFKFRRCIIGVAMGAKYEKQTDGMIDSFLKHNPDWKAERVYGDRLRNMLPAECRNWTPFDQCEIGRWIAMRELLHVYDTVVYSDGDIHWYGQYETHDQHSMVLYPHYVTRRKRQECKHQLFTDGIANIGIIEMSRSVETEGRFENARGIFDFVIGEVLHNPKGFQKHGTLWLQPLVSSIPDCGYDCVYNYDAGYDVAWWNLRKGDRELVEWEGRLCVGTPDDRLVPLVSFHFSSKSLEKLRLFGGDLARRLLIEYERR